MSLSLLAHPRLRRLAGARSSQLPVDRCGVCASAMAGDHRHLLEIDGGRVVCSCRICWLLLAAPDAAGGRLRAIPDRVVTVSVTSITGALWEVLQIPIAVVFFRFSSVTGRVTAFYPSPAGATQSELPLDAWSDVVKANPLLGSVLPDVEAVLVRGTSAGRSWYIVPIDACFELIGGIRKRWTGFSGGDDVRDEIDRFFVTLDSKAAALLRREPS